MLLQLILFSGLIRNIILAAAVFSALVVLLRIKKIREFKEKFPKSLPPCKFKITAPKYTRKNILKCATFSVVVKKHHKYFIDFPVMFRFYSDEAFRSKIKITYQLPGEDIPEEIINQIVVFENKPKEHLYYITDVIIGKIDIEIETASDYGSPTIGFEIMKNDMCNMMEPQKIEISFDKI